MSKLLHTLAHVGLIALQVANASSKAIPPPYNVAVAGVAALVQGILALRAQHASSVQPEKKAAA